MKTPLKIREVVLVFAPLVLFFLLIALLVPLPSLSPFYVPAQNNRLKGCANNLKSLGLAIKMYANDHAEVFPASVPKGYGWAQEVLVYAKSTAGFQCPGSGRPSQFNPMKTDYMNFWMNTNLSAAKRNALSFPTSTLLLGEGADGKDITDATYSKSSMPPHWLTDTSSPAYRHLGGANYLMADGSVHWLKPDEVTTFGGRKNAFAIK